MPATLEAARDVAALERKARRIRATVIQMAHDGGQGHVHGAMSCVDALVALYNGWLRVPRENTGHPERDRFIFSKGHACKALYAVLADAGYIPKALLFDYVKNDSPLAMHPCRHALPLLECSSGSLGHGLGVGTGMAYGLKLDGNPARVAALISDGECNEGSTWEAAMFAKAKELNNLLCIVDYNRVQSVGRADELMGHTSPEEKFRAFGWAARTVDGHNMAELLDALDAFPFAEDRPSALIAKTTAGKGVSFMEDDVLWHYRKPSDDDLARGLAELGETPIHLEAQS